MCAVRRSLNLVNDSPVEAAHEAAWIAIGELVELVVIKSDEIHFLVSGDRTCECRLARLPAATVATILVSSVAVRIRASVCRWIGAGGDGGFGNGLRQIWNRVSADPEYSER